MKYLTINIVLMLLLFVCIHSCGNRKSPTGGEKDTESPTIVSINPEPFSDISDRNIQITFSKPINRSTVYASERGIYIYPFINNKQYRWTDNTLTIEINEDLQDDTNYYLTVGRAIRDLRDNQLDKEYTYVFHTGSLSEHRIDGYIAYELEEDVGKKVNINVLSSDSLRIFSKKVTGNRFSIRHLNEKEHIIRAFIDKNNNNRYDIGNEPYFQGTTPKTRFSELQINLQYFDDTKPEILAARASFKNHILVSLNKSVVNFESMNITSADTLKHQLDIVGYDFIEDTIEIITSNMDSLRYEIVIKELQDNKNNKNQILSTEFQANTKQDTTYLQITEYNPRNGAVVETLRPALRISFSKHVLVDHIDFKLVNTMTNQEVSTFTHQVNSRLLMIVPEEDLQSRQTYRLNIDKTSTGALGNPLDEEFELNFLPIAE